MSTRVALFVTCVVDQLFPRTGMAMAEVLERLGCRVEFPEDQTCCGQPAYNSGWMDEAREVAQRFVRVFEGYEYVVAPSGSCVSMVKNHYPELLGADPFGGRVFEFSQFLTDVLRVEDVGARFAHSVTYHDACHSLRELHIKAGPRRLLANVRGLELREMEPPEECCGFGGTFSVKFPHVSQAMGATKAESIQRTGAEYVASADPSCLMNIDGALRRLGAATRTIHLAEILASR